MQKMHLLILLMPGAVLIKPDCAMCFPFSMFSFVCEKSMICKQLSTLKIIDMFVVHFLGGFISQVRGVLIIRFYIAKCGGGILCFISPSVAQYYIVKRGTIKISPSVAQYTISPSVAQFNIAKRGAIHNIAKRGAIHNIAKRGAIHNIAKRGAIHNIAKCGTSANRFTFTEWWCNVAFLGYGPYITTSHGL